MLLQALCTAVFAGPDGRADATWLQTARAMAFAPVMLPEATLWQIASISDVKFAGRLDPSTAV
jgi:hypothetical protein